MFFYPQRSVWCEAVLAATVNQARYYSVNLYEHSISAKPSLVWATMHLNSPWPFLCITARFSALLANMRRNYPSLRIGWLCLNRTAANCQENNPLIRIGQEANDRSSRIRCNFRLLDSFHGSSLYSKHRKAILFKCADNPTLSSGPLLPTLR